MLASQSAFANEPMTEGSMLAHGCGGGGGGCGGQKSQGYSSCGGQQRSQGYASCSAQSSSSCSAHRGENLPRPAAEREPVATQLVK